ncbi:hypothetical protein DKM44_12320 [Deinococcus irradiatisoli]|uniref:DUF937 domain-containing protein n=1 Tax=Deinococcus irradiatisoli TaxID=2202254 RepID=A0A2Z3JRD3_9DEIO|nr:DUF937 domain-containing protein [Deinococcus irradiatisoli]AWN23918.1 hypothetical protein DKM44_12320 [Deinococcus irradiatisoli]
MDMLNMLGLGQGNAAQLGQQLGASPDQMTAALEAAVPLLLTKLGHNAQDPQAAASISQALDEHDGSALDHVQQGNLPNLQDGQAILGHVFGNQQSSAVNAVSQRAGISPQLAMQILSMVAPLVLGYLSRNRSGGSGGAGNLGGLGSILGSVLGSGGLGGLLGGGQAQGGPAQTGSGGLGDLGGLLGNILGGPSNPAPHSPAGSGVQGGVGLEPLNQQHPQSGNPLEDLIGMFGGQKR